MIAFLKGKILQKTTQFLIVEQGGIGYKIFCTPEVLEHNISSELELYIYHKSADDGETLFGMPNFATLQFFELLITVTGVGPKMALTIVSAAKIDTLQQAIVANDVEIFTRMSGVGKKTAERIILELKNKVGAGLISDLSSSGSDLFDALTGLGYNPREVREIIPKLDGQSDMQDQLKQALKLLAN
jgi:holliday junction DNA helicase RuvA